MHADTHSTRNLFGQSRRYVVPLYQRGYVWQRSTHWEPLWDDVVKVAERVVAGEAAPRAHFMGAIVLEQQLAPTGQIETRLVIDGQQRLTTLQLLLEALSDFCLARGLEKRGKSLELLTRNNEAEIEEEDEQFKIWPTSLDQDVFRKVMAGKSPTEVLKSFGRPASSAEVGHSIPDAYLFFWRAIEEWVDGDEGSEARVEALQKTLASLIRLVVIDLGPEDDAQVIFETLNARGTPLLASDLVKNALLHRARRDSEDVDKIYTKYWSHFDAPKTLWRNHVGRGHARRPLIDTFLQYWLTLERRDEVPVAHLYAAFRTHLATSEKPARQHLQSITRLAQVFSGFFTADHRTRAGQCLLRLRALDVVTAYPFLMAVFDALEPAGLDPTPILVDIESFIVRRVACQLNTRSYGAFFAGLLARLDGDPKEAASRVREALLEGTAATTRWPTDEEFGRAWRDCPMYERFPQGRVRMILEAVERQLWTNHREEVELPTSLTIEHVMPVKWQTHWPLPAGSPPEIAARREVLLHTIGNLSLLTAGLNPTISNGPWATKRPALAEHSALFLNKDLAKCEAWGEEQIAARASALLDVAKRVWPRPA